MKLLFAFLLLVVPVFADLNETDMFCVEVNQYVGARMKACFDPEKKPELALAITSAAEAHYRQCEGVSCSSRVIYKWHRSFIYAILNDDPGLIAPVSRKNYTSSSSEATPSTHFWIAPLLLTLGFLLA